MICEERVIETETRRGVRRDGQHRASDKGGKRRIDEIRTTTIRSGDVECLVPEHLEVPPLQVLLRLHLGLVVRRTLHLQGLLLQVLLRLHLGLVVRRTVHRRVLSEPPGT
jgi:hypothetical protein